MEDRLAAEGSDFACIHACSFDSFALSLEEWQDYMPRATRRNIDPPSTERRLCLMGGKGITRAFS